LLYQYTLKCVVGSNPITVILLPIGDFEGTGGSEMYSILNNMMIKSVSNKSNVIVLVWINVVLAVVNVGLFWRYSCCGGEVVYFLLVWLGLFLVVIAIFVGQYKTGVQNWSILIGILLLIINISIGLVFFNYFLIQIGKLEFDHDTFRSVIGDLQNLSVVRSTKGSNLEVIETVDRLLIEFDIKRFLWPEEYEYHRTRFIANYINPEQTREEIELLRRTIVNLFFAKVDLVCQQGRFYPISRSEKETLMRDFTTWENLFYSIERLSNQKMRASYRTRHW
jgi:hypothetical protein